MPIPILWTILFYTWTASEIIINVATRAKGSDRKVQDRGSLLILWIVIFPCIAACEGIRRMATSHIAIDAEWPELTGLALFIAGLAIRWVAIVSLGKSFTANVATRSTQQLHRTGLYRFVRHPSYLGLLLIFSGIGVHSNNWFGLAIAIVPTTAALLYRVRVEEAALRGAFGRQYVEYSAVTKRLIPGLFALLLAVSLLPLHAEAVEENDRYPEIRALLREAENSASEVTNSVERNNLLAHTAKFLAGAGYLDDAARLYKLTPFKADALFRARVVYGDLLGVDKSLQAIADPDRKALAMESVADILWRMGDLEEARAHFNAARRIAGHIANPEHRKRQMTAIAQGLEYLPNEPPDHVSAVPHPHKRFDPQNSPYPAFPITPGGFRALDSTQVATQSTADRAFLERLYASMATDNFDGLVSVVGCAANPFQNALGMASIEHVLIQSGNLAGADQYAGKIAEVNADCLLAKAEAFTSAAVAWLHAGDDQRAGLDFEEAAKLAISAPDLPYGKVSVILSIARAQSKGGLAASGAASFQLAAELAQVLPPTPAIPKWFSRPSGIGTQFREDAYKQILLAAIQAHNLGAAREVADRWNSDGKAGIPITLAWRDSDRIEEGIAFARTIPDAVERTTALLFLASRSIEDAGVPNF